ncbi:NEL-type E3 ubiquitin ligase domain-containing protein [Pseudomonas putida]|uniref:NEL-type E3 ubiquitin ligase domain-containing protein n=1 Tax=Pseudomonas putida TaxID=303 RepID=UPI00383A1323
MSLNLYFNERVKSLLARLQAPDTFAMPLLSDALKGLVGSQVDITTLRFRLGSKQPVITPQPIGYPFSQAVYREIPVLEAALRNFSEEQAETGGQLKGNRLYDPTNADAILPTATQFAALCRRLDLGGQYRKHLESVLQPVDGEDEPKGSGSRSVSSLLARAHCYEMLADAHVARLKGMLSEDDLQLVIQVCEQKHTPRYKGYLVQAKRLSMLGCPLEQIVILQVRDESLSPLHTSTHRVLVHIPGDPQKPWSAFPNLRYFANDLGKRLRTAKYQRFFGRFVRRSVAQTFFSQVISGYADVSDLANIDLQEHMQAWPEPLFDSLAQARIARIKEDAAMIAVPVAELDQALQAEHDQRLAAEGWGLLNLAGLFIPTIGFGLLALSAWELLGEVYHGVEAWRDGDASEALDHLLNVAGDLAVFTATAAGVAIARGAWNRAALVDNMLPVMLEDGSTRLWKEDLAPWQSPPPPRQAIRDAQGVHRHGERCWVKIEDSHYPVTQRADGRWQLQPRQGHAPLLEHNGAGAWRFWWEQPQEWNEPHRMFRRLGGEFARLSDDQIDEVMLVHGINSDHLRALHVGNLPADAQLIDSVNRYTLDQRIRTLVSQLRSGQVVEDTSILGHARLLPGASDLADQALAELVWGERRRLFAQMYQFGEPTDDEAARQLRRQFSGLHRRAAAQILRQASTGDRTRFEQTGRLAMPVLEAARAALRQTRVARVLEAFYLDASQDIDLARVAIQLLARIPGAPSDITWRLHDGGLSSEPLLSIVAENATRALDLVHFSGEFELLGEGGAQISGRVELFEAIAMAFDRQQRNATSLADPFAHNLRVTLGRLATANRANVEQALNLHEPIGWFRLPRRLDDGRIGYPLSGRRPGLRNRALYARVRQLYPSFSTIDVENWLIAVRAEGLDHNLELTRLDAELYSLRDYLDLWSRNTADTLERGERSSLAAGLLNCWQRRGLRVVSQTGVPLGYRLNLWSMVVHSLPEIPEQVSFSHVISLSLTNMALREIPESFMRAFSRVETLAMPNNELTRLPPGLQRLSSLRELDLYGNQIVLDADQVQTLAQSRNLRRLNLSFNPLGQVFSVAAMDQLNSLQLRATGITELPPGLLRRQRLEDVDLRANAITQIPDDYYEAPLWVSGAILLGENPLSEAGSQRLRNFMRVNGWLPDEEDALLLPDGDHDSEQVVSRARDGWLAVVDEGDVAGFSEAWNDLRSDTGSIDFIRLIGRLRETRDFRTDSLDLGRRVYTMMRAARSSTELRRELFDLSRGLEGCQDAVIGRFSDLEVNMLVWRARCEAQAGAEQHALLHLGRQLWRLDEVNRIIAEDLQARRADNSNPDEVEVGLAYRLALRDEFDLPGQPNEMTYREIAGVNRQRVAAARTRLLENESDETVAQSLVWKEFWRTHLQRAHRELFEGLSQRFYRRCEVVAEMAEGISYDEALVARQQQIDTLQARDATLTQEAQTLTDDALAINERARTANAQALAEYRAELATIQADTVFAQRMSEPGVQVSSDDYAQWLSEIGRQREAAMDAQVLALTRQALAEPAVPSDVQPQPGPSRPDHGGEVML